MNKEKVYKDLLELLKEETLVEVISYSASGEEETGACTFNSIVLKDEPMKNHTSFKVGGPADVFVDPGSNERLIKTIRYLKEENVPCMIIGNASNIIFRDGGYRGVIITMNSRAEGSDMYVTFDENVITSASGMLLSTLAKIVAEEGLMGMESLSGIPGTVGGAVVMNAGAYGGEIKDIIKSVSVYDPETDSTETILKDNMDLSYRHSIFQTSGKIILNATFELQEDNAEDIKDRMKEYMKRRNEKQPVNMPSAGSFFKRPEGYYAGKLVEDAGFKGLTKGGAQISSLHSGFMVNTGNATAKDIEDLMQVVRAGVMDKFGVMLMPEVKIMGEY